jgi:triosephosphate isomerase
MNERRPLISGNWKMFKTGPEAVAFIDTLKSAVADVSDVDIMIAPPFTALSLAADAVAGTSIGLGAQNLHWEPEGAYTGEISAQMLNAAGCRYVIIGHSERRQYFGETDQAINRKIDAAAKANLIPVFCIGETESQRDAGETFSVLDKQVENGLEGLFSENLKTLVVAYEPVWAIGTGKTATKEQAQEAHAHIRKWFAERYGTEFAKGLRILYGGSVKPSNVKDLMAMEDIDGALVGGASLDPDSFSRLVHFKDQVG